MRASILVCGLALAVPAGTSGQTRVDETTYARAERLLGWHANELIAGDAVVPTWMVGGQRFWYRNNTGGRRPADGDEATGRIWFAARGREEGMHPNFRQLDSVGLDGSGLIHLSAEDADHTVRATPDGRFFVDAYSRPDVPPRVGPA